MAPPVLTHLGKHTVARFMREVWQRRPLLIRQALPDFHSPVSREQLIELAMHDDVESRCVTSSLRNTSVPPAAALSRNKNRTERNNMNQQMTINQASSLQTLVRSEGVSSRFREVLGQRAPQFISSLIQVGNSLGPDCDAMSIISGAMTAASLDLPINKNLGFAWLVPFKQKGQKMAQFQLGYKGYIQLSLRTGRYSRMNAGAVNAECVGGFDSVGERVINFEKYDRRSLPLATSSRSRW